VFVDDIDLHCEAARDLGMVAVQFQDTEQAIAAIDELLEADRA
jgi:FMN phosphatase YigB (HAD superfamily)